MAFDTLHGIVLRHTDYRENDRILNVLSRERGLISLTARACRKANSPIASICEIGCYGEFTVYERNGVLYISGAAMLESFYPIREDYDKLVSATQIMYMTKLLTFNRQPWEDVFSLCYHALSFIAYTDQNPIDIELCFAVKLLKIAGYQPTLTTCAMCGKDLRRQTEVCFSKAFGGSLCTCCGAGSRSVAVLTLEAMRRMLNLPLADMGKVKLPKHTREELDKTVYEYAEHVFEQKVKLRGR